MDILVYLFVIITIGGNVVLWGGLTVNMYWRGNEEASITFLLGLLANFLLNKYLKLTFRLPRPSKIPWKEFGTPYGFPSGHAQTIAFVTAYFTLEKGEPRSNISFFLVLLTGLVSYSRIFLGYHYFYDVLGGSGIGVLTGFLYWKGKEIWENRLQWSQLRLVLSVFGSVIGGIIIYLISPLYPILIAGVLISTFPPSIIRKLSENTEQYNLTYKILFVKLFLGNCSLFAFSYVIYEAYLLGRNISILLFCFLGGIWIFYVYPLLFSTVIHRNQRSHLKNECCIETSYT